MFRDREIIRRRLKELVQRFREKGATTPEKAMSIEELGLPPRFEQAMHRRLGQTRIFIEVNNKYYLDEERLKQIQEQRGKAGYGDAGEGRETPGWSRYLGVLLMLPIGLIVAVVLFYFLAFSGASLFPGEFLIILIVAIAAVALARIFFWRSRRQYWQGQW